MLILFGLYPQEFANSSVVPDIKAQTPKVLSVTEEQLQFSWSSADGTINLSCNHWQPDPTRPDWEVICGKGTKIVKQYMVHLLIRKYEHRQLNTTAFEVMYWITDRQTDFKDMFKSINQWIELPVATPLNRLSMSQGIENDYALLKVHYSPMN